MSGPKPFLLLAVSIVCAVMFATWLSCSGGLRPSQISQAQLRGSGSNWPDATTVTAAAVTESTQATSDAANEGDFETRFRAALQIGDPQERDQALGLLLSQWVRTTPEAALRLAPQIAPQEIRVHILRFLVQAWALQDPTAALRGVLNLPDPTEQAQATEFVIFKVAESDPERAFKLLAGQPDRVQPALIGIIAQQWATADLRRAFNWAASLPPGETRQEVIQRIAFVWSKTEPENSANFILDQMTPGPAQTEAAISVLHQWALRDLPAATAWAIQFPMGQLRERAMGEISGIARMERLNYGP